MVVPVIGETELKSGTNKDNKKEAKIVLTNSQKRIDKVITAISYLIRA